MIIALGLVSAALWLFTAYLPVVHSLAWLFVALMLVQAGILLAGFRIVTQRATRSGMLKTILFFGILFRVICLPSDLIFEDDIYRYLWDGYMVRHGLNPYIFSPEETAAYSPAETGWLAEVEDTSRAPYHALYTEAVKQGFPYQQINYPQVPTIYPPLTQAVFAGSAFLFPLNPTGLKAVLLLFDLATLGVLILLLRQLKIPDVFIILYAWHPLIIKEFANSGHHDSIGLFCMLMMLLMLVRGRNHWSGFWFGLTVLVKLLPVIMLPVLYRRFKWKGITLFMGVLVVGYLPLLAARGDNFQGLMIYLEYWTFNSLPFSVFREIAHAVTGSPETANLTARAVSAGLILGVAVFFGWRTLYRPPGNCLDHLRSLTDLTLLVFLLLPVCDPWYVCWLIPLGVITGRMPVLIMSVTVFLSYLYYDLHTFPLVLLIVEFGCVYLAWIQLKSRQVKTDMTSLVS